MSDPTQRDIVLWFGKHNGMSLRQIAAADPNYLYWLSTLQSVRWHHSWPLVRGFLIEALTNERDADDLA